MVFMSGYQRDFGAQATDPQLAQSWDTQYKDLFKSCMEEEQRRKIQGTNWSAYSSTPLSMPRP